MIFEEFHQVGNPARDRREGLGLGLAIVQRLAVLLDHEVDVVSREDHGSWVAVTLPVAKTLDRPIVLSRNACSGDVAGALVVGIGDEEDIRDALGMLLDEWGYQGLSPGRRSTPSPSWWTAVGGPIW
ncbi:MAG: ATP-binding protein [Rhodospirillaceae bacterium]